MKYISACELHQWTIWTWQRDNPGQVTELPYRCRSWRHSGPCREWRGAIDFARCEVALSSLTHWCHLNLTFYQPEGVDPYELFRDGVHRWAALRKRLVQRYGKYKYIQTWEIHKSGIPHVHIALSSPALHNDLSDDAIANFHFHIRKHAIEVGFGEIGWLEDISSGSRMAGYLTKLNNELVGAKAKNQLPLNAPPHFRRIRASKGLLPPPHKDHKITGILIDETTGEIMNVKKDREGAAKAEGSGHGCPEPNDIVSVPPFDPESLPNFPALSILF